MKRYIGPIGFFVTIVLVLLGILCLKVYRYSDCRNVGHTVLYCLTDE